MSNRFEVLCILGLLGRSSSSSSSTIDRLKFSPFNISSELPHLLLLLLLQLLLLLRHCFLCQCAMMALEISDCNLIARFFVNLFNNCFSIIELHSIRKTASHGGERDRQTVETLGLSLYNKYCDYSSLSAVCLASF